MKRALVAIAILTCGLLAALDQGPIGAQEYVSSRRLLPSGSTVGVGTGGATATVGGVLIASGTAVCTTAVTTEEILWTWPLPAGTLDTNDRGLRITAHWSTAANGNTKNFRVYFGAALWDPGVRASNAGAGILRGEILRTGAATQVAFPEWGERGILAMTPLPIVVPTEPLNAPVTIKATCQNGTAVGGDCCFRGIVIEALR